MLNGITENNKLNITASVILLIFTLSVYQATIMMFCSGILICFLLMKEQTSYDEKSYWFIGLKILAFTITVLIGYLITNFIVMKFIFNTQSSSYLSS